MFEALIGFAAGLIVGWNFLPQPVWVQSLWAKIMDREPTE